VNDRLTLLLVEDNPGDARLVREAIYGCGVPVEIVYAGSLADAATRIEPHVDAVLLDLGLPDSTGVSTVMSMRAHAPRLPIVVLTGLNDDAAGLEAVRLGAQDYLVKGEVDGRLIVRAVRYAIERKHVEDRLVAATEALEASNRALDEFVSVASHDLRDPLAKVLALSSILAGTGSPMPDDDRVCLVEIHDSARRMQRLIDALLTYARTVRRPPVRHPVSLQHILHEVLEDLAVRIRAEGAVVDAGDLPVVLADSVQVRQVLQNLLSNALKFAAPGRPPVIRINAAREAQRIRVTVADNGVGFSPEHGERLFQPFVQLGPAREQGAGLGLAICHRIVQAHGGEISATARPGEGATFTFTLSLNAAGPPSEPVTFSGSGA